MTPRLLLASRGYQQLGSSSRRAASDAIETITMMRALFMAAGAADWGIDVCPEVGVPPGDCEVPEREKRSRGPESSGITGLGSGRVVGIENELLDSDEAAGFGLSQNRDGESWSAPAARSE